jgi:hypothetical protein
MDTNTDTQTNGKYTVEVSSGAMIYISICIKVGSGIQKLIEEIRTYRQHGDRISLLWENSVKMFLLLRRKHGQC